MKTFTLKGVTKVSKKLSKVFPPGSTVISQWPGFLFVTALKPASGLENQFWIRVDEKLPDAKVKNFHLMTTEMLKLLPANTEIDGLVLESKKFKRYASMDVLKQAGYSEVPFNKQVRIFARQPEK